MQRLLSKFSTLENGFGSAIVIMGGIGTGAGVVGGFRDSFQGKEVHDTTPCVYPIVTNTVNGAVFGGLYGFTFPISYPCSLAYNK